MGTDETITPEELEAWVERVEYQPPSAVKPILSRAAATIRERDEKLERVRALQEEFASRAEAQRKTGGYECDTRAEAYEEIAERLEAALGEEDNHA